MCASRLRAREIIVELLPNYEERVANFGHEEVEDIERESSHCMVSRCCSMWPLTRLKAG